MKKAQFILFDVLLSLLLVSSFLVLVHENSNTIVLTKDYSNQPDKLLSYLFLEQNFTNQIFLEDLSTQSSTQNWSIIEKTGFTTTSIFLKVSNSSQEKTLFSCSPFTQNIPTRDFIIDNSSLELRVVELGVCT